jgi:hypothetical protein
MYTYTQTHTCTHTQTHKHTHTCMHTHIITLLHVAWQVQCLLHPRIVPKKKIASLFSSQSSCMPPGPWQEKNVLKEMYQKKINIIVLVLVASYVQCLLLDPGTVPSSWHNAVCVCVCVCVGVCVPSSWHKAVWMCVCVCVCVHVCVEV